MPVFFPLGRGGSKRGHVIIGLFIFPGKSRLSDSHDIWPKVNQRVGYMTRDKDEEIEKN